MLTKPNHPDFSSVGRAFDCRCLKWRVIKLSPVRFRQVGIFYLFNTYFKNTY